MKPSKQMHKETRNFKSAESLLDVTDFALLRNSIAYYTQHTHHKKMKLAIVTKPMRVHLLDKQGRKQMFTVPKGFLFDGASIPKVLQPILGKPHSSRFLVAAAFHDYMYQNVYFSRNFADEVFYLLLREFGVSSAKASLMFLGLRAFGFIFKK